MYLGASITSEGNREPEGASTASLPLRCSACAVRHLAICARLSPDALTMLHDLGQRRTLRRGQTLVWEGDDPPLAVNVLSGMLKLSSAARNGTEQIVGLIGPGGFAGRPLGGATAERITALGDTELCIFASPAFRRFAEDHPEIGATLLERSLAELDRARRWMRLLGRGTATERIAALLLDFAGQDSRQRLHALPLSRGEMADFTGLTTETVSRQLSRLRGAGVIALPTRNSFELRDRQALSAIAGETPGHGLH